MENLFGWSDQTWQYINDGKTILAILFHIIATASSVIVVYTFFNRKRIRAWFSKNQFPRIGEHIPMDKYWQGIIFTVSRPDIPKWLIAALKPKYVAFIASESSAKVADELFYFAAEHGVKALPPMIIQDPDSPVQTKQECEKAMQRLLVKGAKTIAIDITGGKVPMSIGAFMAAEEAEIDSIYVSSEYNPDLKKPIMETAKPIGISMKS